MEREYSVALVTPRHSGHRSADRAGPTHRAEHVAGQDRPHLGRGERRREHDPRLSGLPRRRPRRHTTSAAPIVSFSDVGLQGGDSHIYTVTAMDAATNEGPASPASAPITVASGPSAIFSDDFSSGTLANWSAITRFAIDGDHGEPLAAKRARVGLGSDGDHGPCPRRDLHEHLRQRAGERLGADGLDRPLAAQDGRRRRGRPDVRQRLRHPFIRSDVSGVTRISGVALGTGWHTIELCGTVGTAGAWDLYRDGVRIVSTWTANTGAVPVGRLELGNPNAGTWTANFDDIQVDQAVG